MAFDYALEVLRDVIAQNGKPEIINSDQGAQFTNSAWIHFFEQQNIRISMDEKGWATDNILVSRLASLSA